MSLPKKEAVLTTREVKVTERVDKQKENVIVKCPMEKPTAFRFKYTEGWVKEDTRHFHDILRKNDLDLPLENYKNKELLTEAFDKLKEKANGNSKRIIKQMAMGVSEVTPLLDDKTSMEDNNTVDQFIYDNVRPKYVKVIQTKPYKIVWGDRRFCQYETIPIRKIDELARQGIDVNQLRIKDSQKYYDLVVRCPDAGIRQHEGKYYCRNHFRDKKYGRLKNEDLMD